MAGVGKPSKKLLFSSAKLNLANLITEKIKIRNEKYLRSVSDNSAIWKKRTVDGNAPKEIKSANESNCLPNSEITRIFSVIRFLLPESVIKISGGRETNLDDSGEELLQSGANGIITQGYLTMDGNNAQKDRKMIEKIGLEA